jgi:flagellar basal body-associated protein FliL
MAEEAKKKAEAPPPAEKKDAAAAPAKGGLLSKTPVLLGAAMIVEAVVLFGGFKFLGGGPKASQAVELAAAVQAADKAEGGEKGAAGAPADKNSPVEIPVIDFRAPNKQTGRTYLYDVSIYVVAKQENSDAVKALITSHSELIQDRIRTIIAQSDPDKLGGGSEPGLETLRRQIKYQLDQIVGDGLIDEVLIPRCIPYRADF